MKIIFLSGERARGRFVMVSDEDVAFVSQWQWNFGPKGYAIRTDRSGGQKRTLYLHKEIGRRMGFRVDTLQVDHRNTKKLDNTRGNLREATNQLNQANVGRQKNNTSGFKGVSWHRHHNKFQARIGVNRKRILLGFFERAEDAYAAYCAAAVEHFGEFARF